MSLVLATSSKPGINILNISWVLNIFCMVESIVLSYPMNKDTALHGLDQILSQCLG